MTEILYNDKLNLGIVGCFQNGKSTFVNCMLDDKVARTGGEGLSVTSVNVRYIYGDTQNVTYYSKKKMIHTTTLQNFLEENNLSNEIDEVHVQLWKPILRYMNIIDTPGFNANDKDTTMAMKAMETFDAAIVIIGNNALSQSEISILMHLKCKKIPFYVIMNCLNKGGDSWNPSSSFNEEKVKEVVAALINRQLYPQQFCKNEIVMRANLLWFWYISEQYMQEPDNKQQEIIDDIMYYINRHLKNKNDINKFLLDNSRILPIRQFFDTEENWFFPLKYIRWNVEFERIFKSWEDKIETIIKHC